MRVRTSLPATSIRNTTPAHGLTIHNRIDGMTVVMPASGASLQVASRSTNGRHLMSGQPALPHSVPVPALKLARAWPSVLLLGVFWTVYSIMRWTELGVSLGFAGFVIVYGAGALAVLLFSIWWLAASRVGWAERLGLFGVAVFVGGCCSVFGARIGPWVMLMPGLPLVALLGAAGGAILGIRHSVSREASHSRWSACLHSVWPSRCCL